MRCVFFSLVSKVKGAGLVLDAAKELPQVEFHFYGRVEEDFKDEFERRLAKLPNSSYHGVFDSVKDDVLAELNQYDLHMLPTSWPNEGVPGVLVETKMAAVPSIVSDCCHNAEIVRDGADGIVGGSRFAERLPECVRERRRCGRGGHAGLGVEPADAVEILRRLLRRRVALALFGDEMDDDRLLQ